ncbi:MAG: family 78 glycoside hydrolase catalytic domain [Agathobacter sp.]|nr:family 78 glycoside hydrolase catalytic domain [Agathobacter sp.]
MLNVRSCKTEYLENPIGIDAAHPRFSWMLESDKRGCVQKNYQITVISEGNLIWDSGIVEDGKQQRIRYDGKSLMSRQQVSWKVNVTIVDENGEEYSAVSQWNHFEMGLLEERDWYGKWIEPEDVVDEEERKPSPLLRKSFQVKKGLVKARIYQSAHGLYHFWMNGISGTEDCFKPGLTSYYHRIQYQVYDIAELLEEGENVWTVQLADGWWRGVSGGSIKNNFGYKLHYLGQIELFYEDGTKEVVGTDETFRWTTGGLLASDMLMGDIYDARKEPENWKHKNYDDKNWTKVHITEERASAVKIASRSVPVREREEFKPICFIDKNENKVLDFGQNIAGYVRMRLRNCKEGQTIHLYHGEALKEGVFSTENVRNTPMPVPQFQEVIYTCKGEGIEEYCPMFSVFGFRYVMIEGCEDISEEDFTAIAVYSDMEEVSNFQSSHPLINQLVKNSLWSQKGNFLDVAVDCPTRERNAWTGDAQIYVRTATDFMNVYSFYEKWLQDQTIEQYGSGKVGITFPATSSVHNKAALAKAKELNASYELAGPKGNGNMGEESVGWGDSAVWIPYILYLCYGDKQILENQYDTAKQYVEYMLSCAKKPNPLYENEPQYHAVNEDGELEANYIYDTNFHYGEWNEPIPLSPQKQKKMQELFIRAKTENRNFIELFLEEQAREGKSEVATAYLYRSLCNLSHMASILDKTEDEKKYGRFAKKVKAVYQKYLIKDDGSIEAGHQAPYVRALQFGLCEGKQKELVLKQLIREIEANNYCLNTGFLSTAFLLPVLVDNGQTELAYNILEQTQNPSWLHAIELGATTILERWEGMDEFKDSFNHYSYGSVCEFLFAYTAGIRPMFENPGYKEFIIQPVPGGTLTKVQCEYQSPYGRISVAWEKMEDKYVLNCNVPVNTKAHVLLPGQEEQIIGSGDYQFKFAL